MGAWPTSPGPNGQDVEKRPLLLRAELIGQAVLVEAEVRRVQVQRLKQSIAPSRFRLPRAWPRRSFTTRASPPRRPAEGHQFTVNPSISTPVEASGFVARTSHTAALAFLCAVTVASIVKPSADT